MPLAKKMASNGTSEPVVSSSTSTTPSTKSSDNAKATTSSGVWYLCPNAPCDYRGETLQTLGEHIEACKHKIQSNQTIVYLCPNKGCNFKSDLVQLNHHVNDACAYRKGVLIQPSSNATSSPSISSTKATPSPAVTNGIKKPSATNTPTNVAVIPPEPPRSSPIPPLPKKASCSICKNQFDDQSLLIQHMSTVHKMKAHFKCSTCLAPFPSKDAVEKHIIVSHPTKSAKTTSTIRGDRESSAAEKEPMVVDEEARDRARDVKNKPVADNNQATEEANQGAATDEVNKEVEHVVTEPDLPPPMEDGHAGTSEEYHADVSIEDDHLNCLTCGLEFDDKDELVNHESRCPDDTLETIENIDNLSEEFDYKNIPQYFKHFKHQHINLVSEADNVYCKHCLKKFEQVFGLCNHLSRRLDCREWYCRNLASELNKAKERRLALGLPVPSPIVSRRTSRPESSPLPPLPIIPPSKPLQHILPKPSSSFITTNPVTLFSNNLSSTVKSIAAVPPRANFGTLSGTTNASGTPKRNAAIAAENHLKKTIAEQQAADREMKMETGFGDTSRKSMPLSNRLLRCRQCKKIFGGKSPHVAFRNHQRGSKVCLQYAIKAEVIVQESIVNAYQARNYPVATGTFTTNQITSEEQDIPKYRPIAPKPPPTPAPVKQVLGEIPSREAIATGVKYYCKLCPKREIKNRVSLGCHLTIYHGLPQVNCDASGNGEAYRCQNCNTIFNTKHYYNNHRKECDYSSPYVGIIDEDGNDAGSPVDDTMINEHRYKSGAAGQSTSSASNMPSPAKRRVLEQNAGARDTDFFTNRYKCKLCGKQGFWGPNAVKIHQKYQCVNRDLGMTNPSTRSQPPRRSYNQRSSTASGYPEHLENNMQQTPDQQTARTAASPQERSAQSDRICEGCGEGPFSSVFGLIEHRQRCGTSDRRSKKQSRESDLVVPSRAGKTTTQKRPYTPQSDSELGLPRVSQRARKSLNGTFPLSGWEPGFYNEQDDDVLSDAREPEVEMPEMPEYTDQIIKCLICTEEFESLDTFVYHRIDHISKAMADSKAFKKMESETLTCEICSAIIVDSRRMQYHLILHLKNFSAFKNKKQAELKRRKPSIPNGSEKELHCAFCQTMFYERVELAKHMRSACSMKHKCKGCDRVYLSPAALRDHKCARDAHLRSGLSKQVFKCKNCYIDLKDRQDLQWHEQSCPKVYTADLAGQVEVRNFLSQKT